MSNLATALLGVTAPAQDFFTLGGAKSPGRATLHGAALERTWQKNKAYGMSGASIVHIGDELSEFSAVVDLWLDEHWPQWIRFAKTVALPPPTRPLLTVAEALKVAKSKALDIKHPLLILPPLNITSVVVRGVSQFEQDDEGLWSCEIKFIQYRAPIFALSKPAASTPGVKTVQAPADANEQIMNDLLAQQKALGGIL